MAPFSMCPYVADWWHCGGNGIWLWGSLFFGIFSLLSLEYSLEPSILEKPSEVLECSMLGFWQRGEEVTFPNVLGAQWCDAVWNHRGRSAWQGEFSFFFLFFLDRVNFQAPGKMVTNWMETNWSKDSGRQGVSLRIYDQMHLLQRKVVSSPKYPLLNEVRSAALKERCMRPGKSKIKPWHRKRYSDSGAWHWT